MKLEQINWVDARSIDDWVKPQHIDTTDGVVKSVGWVIRETKKTVVLAASYYKLTDAYTSIMVIPKCCIKKRRQL